MKINLKYNIFGLALLIIVSVMGCKEKKVTDPIDPAVHPVATFTTDFTGNSVFEGDTIKYTITIDKMLTRSLTFSLKVTDTTATAVDGEDFTWEPVVMAPYTNEVTFNVIFKNISVPRALRTAKFEIGVFQLAEKNLLGPATKNPVHNLTIMNNNARFSFEWTPAAEGEDVNDMDIVIVNEAATTVMDGWAGATSNNPEYTALLGSVDDGTYYLEVDPYDIYSAAMNFTLISQGSGLSINTGTGTFDMSQLDTYEDGGVGKRIMKIVKVGNEYTFTQLIN